MSGGKGVRGSALIDGLILLVVLTAVPLALLFCCGGKVRKVTDWSVKRVSRICCRRPAAKALAACGVEKSAAIKASTAAPAPAASKPVASNAAPSAAKAETPAKAVPVK